MIRLMGLFGEQLKPQKNATRKGKGMGGNTENKGNGKGPDGVFLQDGRCVFSERWFRREIDKGRLPPDSIDNTSREW